MVEVAALSIAEVRNLERASREGWMRDEDSAKIASSTSSPKAWKFALFQFHFSSVFEGEFRDEIWQSTITRTGRWSEPVDSAPFYPVQNVINVFMWGCVWVIMVCVCGCVGVFNKHCLCLCVCGLVCVRGGMRGCVGVCVGVYVMVIMFTSVRG